MKHLHYGNHLLLLIQCESETFSSDQIYNNKKHDDKILHCTHCIGLIDHLKPGTYLLLSSQTHTCQFCALLCTLSEINTQIKDEILCINREQCCHFCCCYLNINLCCHGLC